MNEQHAIGAHGFPLSYVEESEAYYKQLALIDQREWTRNVRRYPTLYNFDQIGTCIDHEQNGFGSDACQINAFERCPVCQDILEAQIKAADRLLSCRECRGPMEIGSDSPGVSHHLTDDGETDYDACR